MNIPSQRMHVFAAKQLADTRGPSKLLFNKMIHRWVRNLWIRVEFWFLILYSISLMLLCLFMRGVSTSGTWNWPQLEVSFFSIEGCISVVTAVAVIALLLVLFKIMLILIYQFDNWLRLLVMECKAIKLRRMLCLSVFFFGSVGVISSLHLWSAVFQCSSNSPVNLFINAAGHLEVNVWAWVRTSSRLCSLFLIRHARVNDSFFFFSPFLKGVIRGF